MSSRPAGAAAERAAPRVSWRAGDPAFLYIVPALALYAVFVLWPILRVCWLALQQWSGYGPEQFTGLANFPVLWNDATFRTSLAHSLLWELAAVIAPTLLALPLALLIRNARGRTLGLALLFFPVLLPPTVVAAVWTLVYSPLSGLLNDILHGIGLGHLAADWLGDPHLALGALFVAWLWSAVGAGTLIFWSALIGIGREYVELALVEGAGPWWRFSHVILPGVRRLGAAVILLNAALAAQVFDLVFVVTGGGPGYATMLLPIDMYGRAFGGHAGQGAAEAVIQLLLGFLLVLLVLVLLRQGGESLDTGMPAEPRPSLPATGLLTVVLAVSLLPILWLIPAALEPGRQFALGGGPSLDPRGWTLSNFTSVWTSGMAGATLTSLLVAGIVTAGTLLLATPAAYTLARLRSWSWRAPLLGAFLIGLLQPTPVLIIPLFALLRSLNLLDSVWGVVLPEIARALPFAVLVLWAFLWQSPREILEAARLDGASARQEMLQVAIPLVRPALFAAAVWAFVTSWNEYLLPTIVSQDGTLVTVPTLLGSFIGKFDTQLGALAAGSLMALAPSLIIYLLLRRPAGAGLLRIEKGMG